MAGAGSPHLEALLDAQAPHFLHQQEDLVAARLDVVADLFQLQVGKVLRHGPGKGGQLPGTLSSAMPAVTLTASLLSMMQKFSDSCTVSTEPLR
jgi:hypothetical protein